MVLDPKDARPRTGQTPAIMDSTRMTADEARAAKLYGKAGVINDRLPDPVEPTPHEVRAAKLYGGTTSSERRTLTLGSDSPSVRIDPSSIHLSDGRLHARVTMPVAPPIKYTRVKLNRDRNRPLEFDGRVIAEVNEPSHDGAVMLRAAVYETKASRYVTEVTRYEVELGVDYGDVKPPYLFAKAEVFDSRDLAAMWFRTKGGRLTERLMQQLGDVESEFIA